jgi:DNA-binding PadR family transcriptional regulator
MTDEIELTPTSFIVLGLLSRFGDASPYDLKQMASASVGRFWTLPHSQLYAEPARLARAGYLTEEQEQRGRRRKRYSLATRGRRALDDWLGRLTPEPYVLRDLALLKLFFGADVGELANGQLETHRRMLAEFTALSKLDPGTGPRGPWLALDLGIKHERAAVRFWEEHSRTGKEKRQAPRARRSPRSA